MRRELAFATTTKRTTTNGRRITRQRAYTHSTRSPIHRTHGPFPLFSLLIHPFLFSLACSIAAPFLTLAMDTCYSISLLMPAREPRYLLHSAPSVVCGNTAVCTSSRRLPIHPRLPITSCASGAGDGRRSSQLKCSKKEIFKAGNEAWNESARCCTEACYLTPWRGTKRYDAGTLLELSPLTRHPCILRRSTNQLQTRS